MEFKKHSSYIYCNNAEGKSNYFRLTFNTIYIYIVDIASALE